MTQLIGRSVAELPRRRVFAKTAVPLLIILATPLQTRADEPPWATTRIRQCALGGFAGLLITQQEELEGGMACEGGLIYRTELRTLDGRVLWSYVNDELECSSDPDAPLLAEARCEHDELILDPDIGPSLRLEYDPDTYELKPTRAVTRFIDTSLRADQSQELQTLVRSLRLLQTRDESLANALPFAVPLIRSVYWRLAVLALARNEWVQARRFAAGAEDQGQDVIAQIRRIQERTHPMRVRHMRRIGSLLAPVYVFYRDLFWRGAELCVAQYDPRRTGSTRTMRCYDTERSHWRREEVFNPPQPITEVRSTSRGCDYEHAVWVEGIEDGSDASCGGVDYDDVMAVSPGPVVVLAGFPHFVALTRSGTRELQAPELQEIVRRSSGTRILDTDYLSRDGTISRRGADSQDWTLPVPIAESGWTTTVVSPDQRFVAGVLLETSGRWSLWVMEFSMRAPTM